MAVPDLWGFVIQDLGLSFLRLTLLFLIFHALRTTNMRRSKNQKPPSQPQKILRLKNKYDMLIIEAAKPFCGVEIDMDEFADCTKRGERSSTKLYNQEFVYGTREAECFAAFFIFEGCRNTVAVFCCE